MLIHNFTNNLNDVFNDAVNQQNETEEVVQEILDSAKEKGSLIVEVLTDPSFGPSTPIPDIKVVIKEIINGAAVVIKELITNSVGQTDEIELDAPPEVLSENPEYIIPPYSTYIIETSGKDYIPTIIEGAQIFPKTKSIQAILLIPNSPNVFNPFSPQVTSKLEEVSIGEPTLYGDYPPKIPESEVKNTSASGFVVLDEVVVPEYIIVHDGSPNNNNAANYNVKFKDYIKNVASSEIYPTWPRETIKANVIAIVSFTLNRVYTEWYRNQGKWFTITTSTAFDHAFYYGRNIFDSISEVVDECFDLYVKRPGVKQPLLTQYCDGQKSTCPGWMTQWGSQKLGEDGLSAEQILKYFYGYDIEILSAPVVAGNPESYPGTSLKEGSTGTAVRTIQEQLNRISNNFPLIPKVVSNGVFGPETTEAVKVFQKIFHLTADGIVGKSTWYKISEIYVAVTKIAELN